MSVHKLRALQYLVAVADHGGFAPAARWLGLTAPSVHRLVCALETELGVQLLDRNATPIKPLPDAREYVAQARFLVEQHRALDDSLCDRASAPAGMVIIAAQNVAIQYVLAQALPHFHRRFPDVRIEVRDAGNSRDVNQLGADVLLQFGWPPPQDAIIRTLAHTRWIIVGAPALWKMYGVPTHPRDLEHVPCAVFRTPYGETVQEWTFERGRDRVAVKVDGWLTAADRCALDAPVVAGQLAACINDLTAKQYLRNKILQPVLLDWVGQHSPPMNLLVRKPMARLPRVRALVEFLVEHAKEMAESRLPAGLPPVPIAQRPPWFKKRVG